jgi:hypothetical protein
LAKIGIKKVIINGFPVRTGNGSFPKKLHRYTRPIKTQRKGEHHRETPRAI